MASVYFNTQVGEHIDSMTSKAFIVCDYKVTSLSGKRLFYYLKINFACAVLRRHHPDVQLIGGHSICDLTSCCNQLTIPHIMFLLLTVYNNCMTTIHRHWQHHHPHNLLREYMSITQIQRFRKYSPNLNTINTDFTGLDSQFSNFKKSSNSGTNIWYPLFMLVLEYLLLFKLGTIGWKTVASI